MTAKLLAATHGKFLIGRKVNTERIGEWPGGPALVIELLPDPDSPQIVFQVRHLTATDPDPYPDTPAGELWEIGVFENEQVQLLNY